MVQGGFTDIAQRTMILKMQPVKRGVLANLPVVES